MQRAPQGALLSRVQAVVEGVLRRELGAGDHELDDLIQSALERVLTTIEAGKFRSDCPLPAFAAVIAHYVAMDAIRERTRERLLFNRDEEAESMIGLAAVDEGPERVVELRGYLARIADALALVPPAKAQVVYLHDVLGYDIAEVARAMNMSQTAAQSRLVRTRNEIVQCMRRLRAGTDAVTDESEARHGGRSANWRFVSNCDDPIAPACRRGARAAYKPGGSKSSRKGRTQ